MDDVRAAGSRTASTGGDPGSDEVVSLLVLDVAGRRLALPARAVAEVHRMVRTARCPRRRKRWKG